MIRGLGYIADSPDPRDILLGSVVAGDDPLPSVASLAVHEHPTLDQRASQACVGFAVAQGIYTRWGVLGSPPYLPSATFIWWLARKAQGTNLQDAPTGLREAFKAVRLLGAARETSWSHQAPQMVASFQPPLSAFRDAYDARFPLAYYRLSQGTVRRRYDFMLAISKGRPVVFGTLVDRAFCNLGFHGALQPFDAAQAIGGHALVATGYDDRGIIGANSWGVGWGNHGSFRLSWSWLATSLVVDAWAVDCQLPGP